MPAAREKKRRTDAHRKGDKTVADHVCAYMHNNHRDESIDSVLTRPLDALRMGLAVAAARQQVSAGVAKAMFATLTELQVYGKEIDAINDVCRAALNGRKHGDLKRDKY